MSHAVSPDESQHDFNALHMEALKKPNALAMQNERFGTINQGAGATEVPVTADRVLAQVGQESATWSVLPTLASPTSVTTSSTRGRAWMVRCLSLI